MSDSHQEVLHKSYSREKSPVVAIGLDSADSELIRRWSDAGLLPNLARLRNEGAFIPLENKVRYAGGSAPYSSTEGAWVSFQTGVRPAKTGYWETVQFNKQTYSATSDIVHGGYNYREFPPFFALGSSAKVATFDLPVSAVVSGVQGIQVCGWGGHFPFVQPGSQPEPLLKQIRRRYGKNPILHKDYGDFWNRRYVKWLERKSIESIRTRTRICCDLLQRDQWDLFLAVYGETHGAAHDLWFASDAQHPVHAAWQEDYDPLLRVFQAVDEELGQLRSRLSPQTTFLVYAVHGIQSNVTDLASLFFLPELMYRFQFPGKKGFADAPADLPPEPPILKGRHNHWFGEIWHRKVFRNPVLKWLRPYLPAWLLLNDTRQDLVFPYELDWLGPQQGWIPAVWYQRSWSRMPSFALPSFSDGHIRVNVQGREGKGIVAPDDYGRELERICRFLERVRDARSGKPVVRQLIRTRRTPFEEGHIPTADLIVVWTEEPFDVIDSPEVGRIGPVPYCRTGGHRNTGFALAAGPAIPAGVTLPQGEAVDLAPTILRLMQQPVPDYFDGRPLIDVPHRQHHAA